MRAPASTAAIVCAAASSRLHRRASQRSGGWIGRIVPRSGQVHTTTSAPASRSADDRLGQMPDRDRYADPVGHVVRADQDDREFGLVLQRPGDLRCRGRPRWRRRPRGSAGRPAGAGVRRCRRRPARRWSRGRARRRTRRPTSRRAWRGGCRRRRARCRSGRRIAAAAPARAGCCGGRWRPARRAGRRRAHRPRRRHRRRRRSRGRSGGCGDRRPFARSIRAGRSPVGLAHSPRLSRRVSNRVTLRITRASYRVALRVGTQCISRSRRVRPG